jgi:hypothetical protein
MATLREHINTNDDDYSNFGGASWTGQIFTTTDAYTLVSVKLKMFRISSPGTLTIRIRAIEDGYPHGPDLITGTINANTFTVNEAGDWYEIVLSVPCNLDSTTQYAIVANYNNAGGSIGWRRDDDGASGGNMVYSDSSGIDHSWANSGGGTVGAMYENWGEDYSSSSSSWSSISSSSSSYSSCSSSFSSSSESSCSSSYSSSSSSSLSSSCSSSSLSSCETLDVQETEWFNPTDCTQVECTTVNCPGVYEGGEADMQCNCSCRWQKYGNMVPSNVSILGIKVHLSCHKTDWDPMKAEVWLSWVENSASWTDISLITPEVALANTDYYLGGLGSLWGRMWLPSEINGNNFQIKVKANGTPCAYATHLHLTSVQAKIYYAECSCSSSSSLSSCSSSESSSSYSSISSSSSSSCLFLNSEDFTKYTKVDPNGRFTVTSERVTFTELSRNESAYVYTNKGIDHFDGDFSHLLTIHFTGLGGGGGGICSFWELGDTIGDHTAQTNALRLWIYDTGALYLGEKLGDADDGTLAAGVTRYVKIERIDDVLKCYIYTDCGRTDLEDTLSITLSEITSYQYLYVSQSLNTSNADWVSGYSEDLDLQEGPSLSSSSSSSSFSSSSSSSSSISSSSFSSSSCSSSFSTSSCSSSCSSSFSSSSSSNSLSSSSCSSSSLSFSSSSSSSCSSSFSSSSTSSYSISSSSSSFSNSSSSSCSSSSSFNSSSSCSSSYSSSCSSSSSAYPETWCITWGEIVPGPGESPEGWSFWSDGVGGSPIIIGDLDWGQLQLEPGDIAHSPVHHFDSLNSVTAITLNNYGIGWGSVAVYYRESDIAFAQDDLLPGWILYLGPIVLTKAFRQIRLVGQ